MRTVFLPLSLLALAACSSTTTSHNVSELANLPTFEVDSQTLSEKELNDLVDEANANNTQNASSDIIRAVDLIEETYQSDLLNKSNSRFDAIPQSGTARFAGGLAVNVVDQSFSEYTALGFVDVTANFSDKTLDVENDGFVTLRNADFDTIQTATGSIDLTNGIIGAQQANSVEFAIAGEVVSDQATISIDGNLFGTFKGSPELKGIYADEGNGITIVNGVRARSTQVQLFALPD